MHFLSLLVITTIKLYFQWLFNACFQIVQREVYRRKHRLYGKEKEIFWRVTELIPRRTNTEQNSMDFNIKQRAVCVPSKVFARRVEFPETKTPTKLLLRHIIDDDKRFTENEALDLTELQRDWKCFSNVVFQKPDFYIRHDGWLITGEPVAAINCHFNLLTWTWGAKTMEEKSIAVLRDDKSYSLATEHNLKYIQLLVK